MIHVEATWVILAARLAGIRRAAARTWRAHRDSRRHRRAHLLKAGMAMTFLLLLVPLVQMAFAEDGSEPPTGPTGHLTTKDSQGYEVWRYELNLDEGQLHAKQDKILWSRLLIWGWDFYRLCVGDTLNLVEFILNFEFLEWMAGPARMVEEALASVIDQIGLWGFLLTISAFLAGFWMLKGRMGVAVTQVLVACLVVTLAQGPLSHPVGMLSGPDGLLMQSQQFGQELTAEVLGQNPDAAVKVDENGDVTNSITARLVDTFIREPHQMLNYGGSFDRMGNQECVDAYNKGLEGAPHGRDTGWRDGIKGPCGEEYFDRANDPGGSLPGLLPIGFAGILLTFVLLILAAGMFLAVGWAIYEATILSVRFLMAVLPGGARGNMWESLGTIAVAIVTCATTLLVLAVVVLLVDAVFANGDGDRDPWVLFSIVDLVLALSIGIAFYTSWGVRKRGKALGQKLNQATSPAPSTASSGVKWLGTSAAMATAGARKLVSTGRRSSLAAAGVGYGAGRAMSDDPAPRDSASDPNPAAPRSGGPRPARPYTFDRPTNAVRSAGNVAWKGGKTVWSVTGGAPVTATRTITSVATSTQRYRDRKAAQLHERLEQAQAYRQEYAQSVKNLRGDGQPGWWRGDEAGQRQDQS